jgi:hypothetical protein
MTTATDLLVILSFLSALYTLLGVLCAAAERVESLWSHPLTRRRAAPSSTETGRRGRRRRRSLRRSRGPIPCQQRERAIH